MALPDFLLPVTLRGAPKSLLARDVTVAEFFHGFPNSVPMAACYTKESPGGQQAIRVALEEWADGLLTRVVIEPRLTLELVRRMGEAREQAVLAYTRTIGWSEEGELAEVAGPLLKAERVEIDPLIAQAETFRPFTTVPVENIKHAIKMLAARCRTAPHLVWTGWRISEFIFNWRVLLQDELLTRRAGASADGGELLAAVGIESE